MARYDKEISAKFQVKYLHDEVGLTLAQIAAILDRTHSTIKYRYDTISSDLKTYPQAKQQYQEYCQKIELCDPSPYIMAFALKNKYHNQKSPYSTPVHL